MAKNKAQPDKPKSASVQSVCTACDGKGVDIALSDTELCKVCDGTGQVTTTVKVD